MRIALHIAAAALLLPVVAGAQGTLRDDIIHSQSLDLDRSIGIYLPEGYDPAGGIRYPVVYSLHGALNGYPGYWTNLQMKSSLDNLIGSGQIEPVIVVTPDGLIDPYARATGPTLSSMDLLRTSSSAMS